MMTLQTKFHVPRPNIEDFKIFPWDTKGGGLRGSINRAPTRRKFEKMKKTYRGNHLTKLCTKFGVNPKMLSGSKIGRFVWDRRTDTQDENNILCFAGV